MTNKKRAAILLANGFEEIEALVPFDLLSRAGIETKLISVKNTPSVTGCNGLVVTSVVLMKDYDFSQADCLVVPGGPAYTILESDKEVLRLIHEFGTDPDKILGPICAGSSIPGKLGLYKDKNYTVVPDLNGDYGGHFEKVHAVMDGNLVTGISVGGAMRFAFDLITKLCGRQAALDLEKGTCWLLPNDGAIFERHSVRNFTADMPSDEQIQAVLDAGLAAPSAVNGQPWELYVTKDKALMEKLAGVSPYAGPAAHAPVLIIPCYKEDIPAPEYAQIDMAICVENMMIEAVKQGLGSVMLGVCPEPERMEAAAKILNLPEGQHCFTLLPVGYPAEKTAKQPKDTFNQARIHWI